MPPKRTRQRRLRDEDTFLGLRVERYEASVDASVNHYLYSPKYARDFDDRDPVYKFTSYLRITATSIYPEERANHTYELTLYANDAPSRGLNLTLRDVQARDKHGSPQYRQYRGKQIPIYAPPKGVGSLNKIKGEPRWTVALFVPLHFASDMLTLLGHQRTLFVALHERKDGRDRWVQGMALQTTDPAEE